MRASSRRLVLGKQLLATLQSFLLCLLIVAISAAPTVSDGASVDAKPATDSLLGRFLARDMQGVDEIIFAARALNQSDGHWYANFGYYSNDPNRKAYANGAKLYRFNLRTRKLTELLADETGG